jgi:isocitrate/isopropylmalate dehydrogenase
MGDFRSSTKFASQYVKQENLVHGEAGKEARATRLITERASHRIGQMAFEIALARPRKVSPGIDKATS